MISAAPLRRMMVERDITWELLSMATGISMEILMQINNGNSITPYNIDILCKTFNCNPEDIIRYEPECDYCKNPLKDFKFCPICGRLLV